MNVTGGEGGTWHIPTVDVIGRGYRGITVDVISGAGHIPDVDFSEEGTGAYSQCGCFWKKGVQAHIPMFFFEKEEEVTRAYSHCGCYWWSGYRCITVDVIWGLGGTGAFPTVHF